MTPGNTKTHHGFPQFQAQLDDGVAALTQLGLIKKAA
jgi:hypothetical protein